MNIACPSCGFKTIEDKIYGTYTICDICGWEDDQVQLANPFSNGGANLKSLSEHQLQSVDKWPLKINEHKGIKRCKKWRTLNNKEIEYFTKQALNKAWSNYGVVYEDDVYWFKNT